ncbi:protein GPR108 [Silurus meridionalis]|uniref:protein GPR108 n=1 Tax=Silurus meridionalis TaxID=175797 RepID=UPI001EECBC4A|nr:protein GPR108 [Silurus meridionalis]
MLFHRVVYALLPVLVCVIEARIHRLTLKNETRSLVHLNTFGFFPNATLELSMLSLQFPKTMDKSSPPLVGFSLARSRVNGVVFYTTEETDQCILSKTKSQDNLILFLIHTGNLSVSVKSFGQMDSVLKGQLKSAEKVSQKKRSSSSKFQRSKA